MKRTISPAALTGAAHLPLTISSTNDLAEIMGRMELNALTRDNRSGVLNDKQLADWLDGANITRHPDDFGAFEILFGFDRHGQDFVITKTKAPNGLHFALIA